jgi:hypothetical protein
VGDITTLCIRRFKEEEICDIALRARIVAYMQKMAGVQEISQLSFRFSMAPMDFQISDTPAIVMTEDSYKKLIELGGGDHTKMPVSRVLLNIDDDKLSYLDRVKMRNKLARYSPDLNMFGADSAVFEEAIRKRFVLVDVFDIIIAFYAFVLCFF